MITSIIITAFLWAVIFTIAADRILQITEKRESDKKRQEIKRYYMMMYYNAPSAREAEYWLEMYNRGE